VDRLLLLGCLLVGSTALGDATPPPVLASPMRIVVARLVDGERPIVACGVLAYIGVYVYEIESVKSGPPLSGRITVDVLCPDFYLSHKPPVRFTRGERHRIELGPVRRSYAQAAPPSSPDPKLPRFEGTHIQSAP
jgi:hypothetical protein